MSTRAAVAFFVSILTTSSIASAAVVEKTRSKGTDVVTSFSVAQSIVCADGSPGQIAADGFILGSAFITKSKGGSKTANNAAFLEVENYQNSCTDTAVSVATDAIADAVQPPSKKLDTASLQGATTLQAIDGGAVLPVAFDLMVQGTGPIETSKESSRTTTIETPGGPVTITISQSAEKSREGTVTGTLTLERFTVTPAFSLTALTYDKDVEVTIEK